MPKVFKIILFLFLIFIIGLLVFLFIGKATPAENITWGAVFSQKQAELLGLDWRANYLAILDDLQVKNLKLVAYWDSIEKEPGVFDFADLDWQIEQAEKRGAEVLLVIGRKVPRWPECHIPDWAKNLSQEDFNKKLLNYLEQVVLRYRDYSAIKMWQVENEPFFPFGDNCPLISGKDIKKEIDLVKSLDPEKRPVVVSESGEFPFWFKAAKYGDMVGHTLYRVVWSSDFKFYFRPPFPPVFYHRKAWLIGKLFNKKVICVELQAEPWGQTLLSDSPLEEQEKTMDLQKIRKIIQYAKDTGTDTFYLWGSEWWYWMKEKQNQPEIWNEIKNLLMQ
ncbi:endo-1,4-beta-xylanase [Patescibacteria group bacterium]|nr:endo-1,4-beta-xylanase [Patescibacteria group bacterium]